MQLKKLFPAYFGPPAAVDINKAAYDNALSQLAQLRNDRDQLDGLIQGYEAMVGRLAPTVFPDIQT